MKQILIFVLSIYHVLCQDKLLAVQAIWRHGARNQYYCNFDCDENVPKGDAALLTPAGMRQQYVLGRWLRQRYYEINQYFKLINLNNLIYQFYFEKASSCLKMIKQKNLFNN